MTQKPERGAFTPKHVRTIRKPGRYWVGKSLYLQVTLGRDGKPRRSWVFRYRFQGKTRELGLGNANKVTLCEAQAGARRAKHLLRKGVDPIDQRRIEKEQLCGEWTALQREAHRVRSDVRRWLAGAPSKPASRTYEFDPVEFARSAIAASSRD